MARFRCRIGPVPAYSQDVPTTSDTVDWVFGLIAVVLGGVGIWVIVVALFRDRSRGRRRCPCCWYDMAGVPGLRCPECGRAARSEKALHRTRRRWKAAGLGAAVVLGAAAVAGVPVRQRGWVSLVPGWLLVRVAPAGESRYGTAAVAAVLMNIDVGWTIGDTLSHAAWRRFQSGTLTPSQAECLARRHLNWQGLDLESLAWVPERWFDGSAVPMRVLQGDDLGCGLLLATAVSQITNGKPEPVAPGGNGVLAPLRGTDEAVLEVSLFGGAGRVLYTWRIRKPCRIVATSEPLLLGVSDDLTTQRVQGALRPYLRWTRDGAPEIIAGERTTTRQWRALNVSLGFEVRVVLDGEILGTGHGAAIWDQTAWQLFREARIEWAAGGLEHAAANKERLRLVVRGERPESDESYVRSPFGKSAKYWSGIFEVPAALSATEQSPEGAPR
jgi:hypothetical protein